MGLACPLSRIIGIVRASPLRHFSDFALRAKLKAEGDWELLAPVSHF
jgi:hypothetical protein